MAANLGYGLVRVDCQELGFDRSECCCECAPLSRWPASDVLYASPPVDLSCPYLVGVVGIVCCHHLHEARRLPRSTWVAIARKYGTLHDRPSVPRKVNNDEDTDSERMDSGDVGNGGRRSNPRRESNPRPVARGPRLSNCIICGEPATYGIMCSACKPK